MFYLAGLAPHLNSLFTADRQLEKTTFLKAPFQILFVKANLHLGGPRWPPKKEEKCVEDLCVYSGKFEAQSRHRLFLQPSELGPPPPLARRRVCPSPFGSGEGVGGTQYGREDRHGGTLGIYVLCG